MRAKSGHFESKLQQVVVRYLRLQGVFVQAVKREQMFDDIDRQIRERREADRK